MTLGGLALAVGILVDDATVEIENINRNLDAGQGDRAGDPRRRRADRGAGVRLDARDLHRVRADVLPGRRRAVPVRAAGRGRRLRDARLLLPVANARADDGEVPPARHEHDAEEARTARRAANSSCGCSAASRSASSACATRTGGLLESALARPRASSPSVFLGGLRRPRVVLLCRGSAEDFFPAVDAGQIKLHLRARDRHADRGDRARSATRSTDSSARVDPAGRARHAHRQHRRARTAASTSRTATRRRSVPATPTSWSR